MTMWMVRAEVGGRLFQAFVERSLVAVGGAEFGDLSTLTTREQVLARVKAHRPEWKPQTQIVSAGVLFRMLRQIEEGDRVVTYDPQRRVYRIGIIAGPYRHDMNFDGEHPAVRPVRWESQEIPRDTLSTSTKNSLGSTLAVFRVPDDAAADVLRALRNEPEAAANVAETEEVEEQFLLHDIEERSVEFIKDRIVRLDWNEMQELVAGLLRAMGYKTRVSPNGPDRGKDIVASPDGFGFEDPRIVVEVKHRPGTQMGAPQIRGFLGGRHPGDKGLYVSTGGFSKDAQYEAERANIPITLMDLDELVKAILDNYDAMDTETQRLVPLKRIFWPVA
ncbi:restriction endonuclease [Futiania mangrovi]|uniref:Restriction endonuclease n=1 Tax=Futiania mangrovi TaxID=2959716 RepID=A0A9J6P9Y3_9PROT|nr:restriction endonuclease [Futiania mangrovii]MCP1335161.1 restriction endonuclease [Futiania mangrovii]